MFYGCRTINEHSMLLGDTYHGYLVLDMVSLRECYVLFTILLRDHYDTATGLVRHRYGAITTLLRDDLRYRYEPFTVALRDTYGSANVNDILAGWWEAGPCCVVGQLVAFYVVSFKVLATSVTTRGRPTSCIGPFINAAGFNAAGPKTIYPGKVVSMIPFGIVNSRSGGCSGSTH